MNESKICDPGSSRSHGIAADDNPSIFDLPLVSVLISNYNYANYLERCVESALSQSYRKIECIVVDDASTDASAQMLDKISARHPEVVIVRRKENGGQSAAALDALARSSGQFIVFLDADDMLLPNAVDCHLHVHMSLRFPVGFTCADMLQLGGDTLMSATSLPLSFFVVANPARRFQSRPATEEAIPAPATGPRDLLNRVYLVEPYDEGWLWSATSAIMFRRDALRFWEHTPGLPNLRYSTDAFFCYGVNAICGSALIDMPLAVYRFHGRNGFAARLPLNHVRTFDHNSVGERSAEAVRLLLKQVKEEYKFYRALCWSDEQYLRILRTFDAAIVHIEKLHETSELTDAVKAPKSKTDVASSGLGARLAAAKQSLARVFQKRA